jgi:HAD superfamily hydrolase (TIGR01549 family)
MYPTFTQAPVKELYRHFQVKAAETVVASTVVLPGAEETLRDLHGRGYHLAIASTKVKRHIDGIVNKFGWQDILTSYSGGDEVGKVKPDPEIFVLTMKRMGAHVGDTMVVGDTINDVEAARAVPMKVTAVRSPYGRSEELLESKPDYFVESLDGLIDVLDNISKEAK